jgi:subtilisin family serine protease
MGLMIIYCFIYINSHKTHSTNTVITKSEQKHKFLLNYTISNDVSVLSEEDTYKSIGSMGITTTELGRGIHITTDDVTKVYNGKSIKVGVLDTGILKTHENFKTSEYDESPRVMDGINEYEMNGYNEHGTHVAGTIGGLKTGIAPGCTLVDLRVLDANGEGTYQYIINGINKAVELECDIISMSLGGDYPNEDMKNAINKAWENGVLLVAAAGNDGNADDSYPASYSNCISVGAVNYTSTGISTSNTSFSQTNDEVDVCGDGYRVYSSINTSNNAYKSLDGTSMATPAIAGFAACIMDYYKTNNIDYTNQNIRNVIEHCVFHPKDDTITDNDNQKIGHGYCTLFDTLPYTDDSQRKVLPSETDNSFTERAVLPILEPQQEQPPPSESCTII